MKKRIISLFLIVCMLVNLNILPSSAAGTSKVKVAVKLQAIDLVENNHVGNEWVFECKVNKKDLQEGDSLIINTTSTGKITIVSTAEEIDSVPDIGSKTLTVSVGKLKANKSNTYTSLVTVTENRGRYSGKKAVWKFTYSIKKS